MVLNLVLRAHRLCEVGVRKTQGLCGSRRGVTELKGHLKRSFHQEGAPAHSIGETEEANMKIPVALSTLLMTLFMAVSSEPANAVV
jgi:hypothetical protein